jgi:hypothetical protein
MKKIDLIAPGLEPGTFNYVRRVLGVNCVDLAYLQCTEPILNTESC